MIRGVCVLALTILWYSECGHDELGWCGEYLARISAGTFSVSASSFVNCTGNPQSPMVFFRRHGGGKWLVILSGVLLMSFRIATMNSLSLCWHV